MSTEALGSAISGLRVAQRALDVTANNITNASTPGYTRKILPQEAVISGDMGTGVRYGEIQRYVDLSLQRDYRVQLGVDSFLDTKQAYLQRIISAHGSTDSSSNVAAQIGALYSSFVELSNNPDSRSQQMSAISQAQRLATSFHNFSTHLEGMRNEVQTTLNNEVNGLNASLRQIAELNKKIQSLGNTGRSDAALQDQRDVLVKEVAKQLDVTYYNDGDNTLILQTKNGQVLVDTEARPITFNNNILTPSMLYPANASGVVIEDSQGGYDLAKVAAGGKIGALLDLRDKTIPNYTAQLDELAHKMMVRFNDQNLRLFTDASGTVPINDPAAYVGLASNIQVNELILTDPSLIQQGTSGPPVNAGSNAVITRILSYTFGRNKDALGTLNEAFISTQVGYDRNINFFVLGDPNATLEEFARSMLDGQAQNFNDAKTEYDAEKQYMQEVEKRLLDTSSVNTDEEMANMIVLQKSYAASAKMISALDQLFRDLLNAI